jgi:mono/diheme cytochrome c family protein
MHHHPSLALGLVLSSLAFVGCGGEDVCAIEANFSSIHANRLSTGSCALSSCHGAAAEGGMNFSLSKNEVHAFLVGELSAGGGNLQRVATSSRAISFLYLKISDDNAEGGRMPPLGDRLPQCEIDAIGAWIDKGAPND